MAIFIPKNGCIDIGCGEGGNRVTNKQNNLWILSFSPFFREQVETEVFFYRFRNIRNDHKSKVRYSTLTSNLLRTVLVRAISYRGSLCDCTFDTWQWSLLLNSLGAFSWRNTWSHPSDIFNQLELFDPRFFSSYPLLVLSHWGCFLCKYNIVISECVCSSQSFSTS